MVRLDLARVCSDPMQSLRFSGCKRTIAKAGD